MLLIVSCGDNTTTIKMTSELNTLSKEEYKQLNNKQYPSENDMRKYTFRIEGRNMARQVARSFVIPKAADIREQFDSLDKDVYVVMNTIVQDNEDEDTFIYEYIFILDLSNSDDEEVMKSIENIKMIVDCKDKNGKEFYQEIELKEFQSSPDREFGF